MRDRGEDLRFAHHAIDRAFLTKLIFAQHLERDDALVDRVARSVHPPHPAGAEQTLDAVRAHHDRLSGACPFRGVRPQATSRIQP